MDNQRFVRNIRNICKEKGISISQVENDLGWSPGLISRWSKACPSFEKVAAIVAYLDITFESLLEKDPAPREQMSEELLVEKLTELTINEKIVWRPCRENEAMRKRLAPLADRDCLIDVAYYFGFQGGYFLLIMAESDLLPFAPRLYIAPDGNSAPILESDDSEALGPILACVDSELYSSWMLSRKDQFIKRFLEEQF